ncbi:hypothetical protein ABW20_dc0103165 [Dactylellina cionopaga]|nr:hypothetical protein ABW20_dc0103165 [Dactylellina cionopaga]
MMAPTFPLKHLIFLISTLLTLPTPSFSATLTPATIPLIVRNPYLSLWLQNARSEPWSRWPMFWTGQEIGLGAMIRVNHTVYPLLGRPHDSLGGNGKKDGYSVQDPKYHGVDFDASKTWLRYSIEEEGGEVDVQLTFTSPITVNNTMRQSIPAGYLEIAVDGNLDCEVYVDLNGLWVTGDRGSDIRWEMTEHGGLRSWKVTRSRELHFSEDRDRAEWGSLYFTAPKDTHYESNESAPVRQRFAHNKPLRNVTDTRFRSVMDAEPIFAFSKHFSLQGNSSGSSTPKHASALFTIAHVQDEVAQFASARGQTTMRPLWKGYFEDDFDLVHFHFHDYDSAVSEADKFNKQLVEHASRAMDGAAAETYTEILLLSTRQVLGGTSFSGTPSRPLLFLKEISSDGNFQTIDVIFPAFPFFLYVNPSWLRYLLEPLLEHQAAGLYPNDYSMHDLGSSFPNATGHPDGRDEYMPVEECGNMLIMGAAAVGSLIQEYGGGEKGRKMAKEWLEGAWGDGGRPRDRYSLWRKWTGYLIEFGLLPENQLSTDDFAGRLANQTNLALKGILGIKAMSELAAVVGNAKDEKYFSDVADSYVKTWHELALTRDGTHTKLAYHWQGSWGTLYNLYADSLLCYRKGLKSPLSQFSTLNQKSSRKGRLQTPLDDIASSPGFVPEDIYTKQSDWYQEVEQKYGLPLDSRHIYTKSDWEFFAAAVATRKTREIIILDVGKWVSETSTDRPFTDLYDTEGDGGFPGINFMARPVVGGHFAVLALERACGGGGLKGLEYGTDIWGLSGGEEKKYDEVIGKGKDQIVLG